MDLINEFAVGLQPETLLDSFSSGRNYQNACARLLPTRAYVIAALGPGSILGLLLRMALG